MSNTITARLADMQETLAIYNTIEIDLATVQNILHAITGESTVWKGEAANVFNNNMELLVTQANTIVQHVSQSKVALTASINAYKILEESNANDVVATGTEFVST